MTGAATARAKVMPNHSILSPQFRWTTADELGFLKGMFEGKNLNGLKGYLITARFRVWHGPGMCVEPGVCILQAEDYVKQLTGKKAS